MNSKHYLGLLLVASCSAYTVKKAHQKYPALVGDTAPAELLVGAIQLKTPRLVTPTKSSSEMNRAQALLSQYANSDEFYEYVRANVPKKLEGGNASDRDEAIRKTRECFNSLGTIPIIFRNYGIWPLYKSAAIGGWDGRNIAQNPRKVLTYIERAGHWFHEITHACKFSHVSNNITSYPIIRKSWPYQSGYAFEDFLIEKERNTLASGNL